MYFSISQALSFSLFGKIQRKGCIAKKRCTDCIAVRINSLILQYDFASCRAIRSVLESQLDSGCIADAFALLLLPCGQSSLDHADTESRIGHPNVRSVFPSLRYP